ncbi:MAG: hypothetical protein JXR78_07730 [Victivallales bacterium]|nr:hypothetical protein [Victivallales bacterium]
MSKHLVSHIFTVTLAIVCLCACVSEPELPPVQSVAPPLESEIITVATIPESVEPSPEVSVPVPEMPKPKLPPVHENSAADLKEWCNIIGNPGKTGFLNNRSFVMLWQISEPFSFTPANGDKLQEVIHHPFVENEKDLPVTELQWRLVNYIQPEVIGKINLNRIFGKSCEYSATYAVAHLYSASTMDNLILFCGSDDFVKVWINGNLVHTYDKIHRNGTWDQDKVTGIKINEGYNTVVVKIINLTGDWNFFFRLAAADGSPLEFIPEKRRVIQARGKQ